MLTRLRVQAALVVCCTISLCCPVAQADFPDRPIRFIVAAAAGGGNDRVARIIAKGLTERWGQAVVVEDRPGAANLIAEDLVAHAAPDGYTILMDNAQRPVNAANTKLSASFDLVNGLAPITLIGVQPQLIVVNPNIPAQSLKELIELAKSKPGKLSYGDYGRGSSNYWSFELLKLRTGADIVEIPYKGTAEAGFALIGGEVDMMIGSVGTLGPQVKAGKARALAVADTVRNSAFPDVPTVTEQIGQPEFTAYGWYGVMAPAGVPKDIVQKLNEAIVAIVKSPEVSQPLIADGFTVRAGTPEEFDQHIKKETATWADLIARIGAP
jgi:tripartite-type tricarboxylate transporter receptor subunit TctC